MSLPFLLDSVVFSRVTSYTELMLKFIYTIFIGILLVAFIAFGVAAFYTEPTAPTGSPLPPCSSLNDKTADMPDCATPAQLNEYNHQYDLWQRKIDTYHRNVSIITLAAAVIFLATSLITATKLGILSDGLLLGGAFTLLYSIGTSFSVQDTKYRFISVSVSLIVAQVLGYIKFIKPQEAANASNKKA